MGESGRDIDAMGSGGDEVDRLHSVRLPPMRQRVDLPCQLGGEVIRVFPRGAQPQRRQQEVPQTDLQGSVFDRLRSRRRGG